VYFNSSESLSEVLLPFQHKAPNQTPHFIMCLRHSASLQATDISYTSPEREKWRKIAKIRERCLKDVPVGQIKGWRINCF